MKTVAIALLATSLFVASLAAGATASWNEPRIDCGPEGKPALNGTACIDRDPVFIEGP